MTTLDNRCGITVTHDSETRLGRRVGVVNLKRVSNLTESTFQVQASKLFNSLPKCLRNLTNCGAGDFKEQLDTYLSTLYDEPPSPGHIPRGLSLTGLSSNSIMHQMTKSTSNLATMRRNRDESDGRRRQPGHWGVMKKEKKACKWSSWRITMIVLSEMIQFDQFKFVLFLLLKT